MALLPKKIEQGRKKNKPPSVEANSFLLLLVGKGLHFSQIPAFEKPRRDNAEHSGLDPQLEQPRPAAPGGLGTMSLPRPWDAAPLSNTLPFFLLLLLMLLLFFSF